MPGRAIPAGDVVDRQPSGGGELPANVDRSIRSHREGFDDAVNSGEVKGVGPTVQLRRGWLRKQHPWRQERENQGQAKGKSSTCHGFPPV